MSARMMMMEAPLTLGELRTFVAAQVRAAFLQEDFLDEELHRIVGGALNAFNWGLITSAGKKSTVDTIDTIDHLGTNSMTREGIIQHVMDTSGLSWQVAEFGVKQIEDRIDLLLRGAKTVNLPWLGRISRSIRNEKGYVIYLSDTLRL